MTALWTVLIFLFKFQSCGIPSKASQQWELYRDYTPQEALQPERLTEAINISNGLCSCKCENYGIQKEIMNYDADAHLSFIQ